MTSVVHECNSKINARNKKFPAAFFEAVDPHAHINTVFSNVFGAPKDRCNSKELMSILLVEIVYAFTKSTVSLFFFSISKCHKKRDMF